MRYSAMQYHSERPLTGSVPAHQHDFDVTPNDRMFVRNNLLTPDIDIGAHRVAVKGLVDRELSFTVAELPMPPAAAISDNDLSALAVWVLERK